jgi:hypothetical protein
MNQTGVDDIYIDRFNETHDTHVSLFNVILHILPMETSP